MRKPIEHTSTITVEMYALLIDCCEKYYENLAWLFPNMCPDGHGCSGLDYEKFDNILTFEIPTLYRDPYKHNISKPQYHGYSNQIDSFDQYALLDFIEFIGQNCNDFTLGEFHSYFGHYHFNLLETDKAFKKFQQEINNIFEKTGLLFILTNDKIIERVIKNTVLSDKVESDIKAIREPGTKNLLEEAINLFKQPNPVASKYAVEKIWGAFERLKTFYVELDKKNSASKIVDDMSNKKTEYITIFTDEFTALTKIGNEFMIRHHETDKIEITDDWHYDYFFNRCLSLISLAIHYLR
jgi:DNA-dependent RNA polymerase auxiliary subunit epsilon